MTAIRRHRESGFKEELDDGLLEQPIVRLTAAQAERLRQQDPAISPGVVVGMQCLAGAVVA